MIHRKSGFNLGIAQLPELNTTWSLTKAVNKFLLYVTLAQSIAILICVYSLVNHEERIVFVPPNISEKTSIGMTNADATYIKSIGVYVTTLIGNLTPKNIGFVIDALSPIMSPQSYSMIRKQLIAQSKDASFKSWVGSTHFEPTDVIYEADTKKVFVPGYMTDINTAGKSNKTQIVYEMKIEMVHGWPQISDLLSYEGYEPKTLKWLELHPTPPEVKE